MKAYLQINSQNIITDCITYPHDGYMETELNDIPVGINGGWWKLENGVIVEIIELNPTTISNQIQSAIDDYTLSLIEEGLL